MVNWTSSSGLTALLIRIRIITTGCAAKSRPTSIRTAANWQQLCDETLDGLFQLQSTQTNFDERQQTFFEISKYMHDNVIWYGIWEDPDIWALNPSLQNVTMSGATPFYSIASWDKTQE